MSVVLTGLAGVITLAAALIFRDQLPLARSAARIVGFSTLYGGVALVLWAAVHLKSAIGGAVTPRTDELVVAGPFRAVRHPVYLGMTIAMVGASIVTRSVTGLLATVLVFLPAELHRARLEERALNAKFGAIWRTYAAGTGFLFPRVRRRAA